MTDVVRVPVALNGWFGAPGVNVLHFVNPGHTAITDDDYTLLLDRLTTMFTAAKPYLANGVTVTFPSTAEVFNDADGALKYIVTDTGIHPGITATADGTESRATQAIIRLLTTDVQNNRVVQGRIFFGPLTSLALAGTGLLTIAAQGDLPNFFADLIGSDSPNIVVWSLPKPGRAGAVHDVRSLNVRDRPGTLRGRNK